MKTINQRSLNYLLITVFVISSTLFFMQNRKLKEEIMSKESKIEELRDSTNFLNDSIIKMNTDFYSIKDGGKIEK